MTGNGDNEISQLCTDYSDIHKHSGSVLLDGAKLFPPVFINVAKLAVALCLRGVVPFFSLTVMPCIHCIVAGIWYVCFGITSVEFPRHKNHLLRHPSQTYRPHLCRRSSVCFFSITLTMMSWHFHYVLL